MQHFDGGYATRWLWNRWQGMAPPRAYGDLHHGMVAWDRMLLWGLRRSQTSGLSWLPAGEPRRVFMAGGSDAHGDWNYRREGRLNGVSAAVDTAIGKPRNLVHVGPERPETVTDDTGNPYGAVGQAQVTSALADGDFAVTDGPALRIVLDANANWLLDEADLPMGGVSHAPWRGAYVPFFVEWKSTDEFGPIESIDLYVGVANDTRDVSVVYAPANHGVHSTETPSGAVTSHPLIDSQGRSHWELVDGYLLDPVDRLHIVPTGSTAMAGRRRVLLRANDFPVGRRRVIQPQDSVCRLVPPHCNPADPACDEVCTDPVPGEWHFDALSLPDRMYVRAFARTVRPAGALCSQTGPDQGVAAYVAQRSGRCIERLAFTNPIWVDNTVVPPPPPDFTIACTPASLTIANGSSGTSTCAIRSINGFASAVGLSCMGIVPATGCHFSPATVTPPANGSVTSTLTVSVGQANPGSYNLRPTGRVGLSMRSMSLALTLTGAPPPGAIATFDARRRAPSCGDRTVGSSCDTGPSLVRGRAAEGAEPNAPNTIDAACADGPAGPLSGWSSNDRIGVSTTDRGNFAPGQAVRIDALVTAPGTPSEYAADFFYTTDATNPSWTLVDTVVPTATGTQTLSAGYRLGEGELQAVRVQFRHGGTADPCATGDQNDRDDLIFAVAPPRE